MRNIWATRRRTCQGAADAGRQAAVTSSPPLGDSVALMVSCIGRRLLMGQRVIEEVEAAGEALGSSVSRVGFFSYGEIAPHSESGVCELHNQTMTITLLSEIGLSEIGLSEAGAAA